MSSSLESAIARRRPAAGLSARHPYTILPLALAALVGALAGNALAQGSAPPKGSGEHIAAVTKRVDGAFIRANAARTPDWPSHGLDYAETRFSKLNQVNAANVKDLGLVWSYDLESTRGMKPEFIEHLDKFVFDGPASERGMPNFTGKLSPDDVEKIKAFIQGTADAIRPKN